MNRRAYLKSLTATGSAVLGGCLSEMENSPSASLAGVLIENFSYVSVDVVMKATKDGVQVHDKRHTVPGVWEKEFEDGTTSEALGMNLLVNDWMGSQSEYELQFTVPDYGLEASFDMTDTISLGKSANQFEGDCYLVLVSLQKEKAPIPTKKPPDVMFAEGRRYRRSYEDLDLAGDCGL